MLYVTVVEMQVCINYEESLVLEAAGQASNLPSRDRLGVLSCTHGGQGGCPGQSSGSRTPTGEKRRRAESENVSVCGEKQPECWSEETGGARRSPAFGNTHTHALARGELRVARLTQIIPSQLCQAFEETGADIQAYLQQQK